MITCDRGRLTLFTLLVSLGIARGAAAQTTQSSTIAEALFRDAQSHLTAGQIHQACDLFERSQKVEPATGTLLNLAACHERDGRTATAWTEFSLAAAQASRAGDAGRAAFATSHIASLEKQLHRVVVEILEPVPGMLVTLDGGPLAREAWGTAIPLDPGEHSIEVHASGYAPWVRKVNMGPASGTDRIEVRLVADVPSTAPVGPVPAAATSLTPAGPAVTAPPPAPTDVPTRDDGDGQHAKRAAGFVVGGVGVVSLGVSIGLAVAVASNVSDRNALCTPGLPCGSAQAFSDDHTARVDQTWAFVAGGTAVAALAVGTYLVVSSYGGKKGSSQGVLLLPMRVGTGNGFGLQGSF